MTIISMYITLIPTVLAGIFNMIFCKLNIFNNLKKPIDNGKKLRDGKRIFGDNKTWKGLVGYLVLNVIMALIWGVICKCCLLEKYNYFYVNNQNNVLFNLLVGLLLGLGYSLFELPNSFIKRRLDIEPGKTISGLKKIFFIFLDQADSVFGCCLVVWLFYDLGIIKYLLYVLLGAITHVVLNMFLYLLKLRKNMF